MSVWWVFIRCCLVRKAAKAGLTLDHRVRKSDTKEIKLQDRMWCKYEVGIKKLRESDKTDVL